jgi:hypothetical protein
VGKTGLLMDMCEGGAYCKFYPINKLSLISRLVTSNSRVPRICASAEIGPDFSHLTSLFSDFFSILETWVGLRNFHISKVEKKLFAKLSPRYLGPFSHCRVRSPVSVRLTDQSGTF